MTGAQAPTCAAGVYYERRVALVWFAPTPTVDALNLKLPDYYINRELSQLAFNVRVLKQAMDTSVPLLERLKFLCISSTNLDEFFEIRVSGLKHRLAVNAAPAGPDNLSSADVLRTVAEQTGSLVAEQYRVLNDELIPKLREAGIRFVRRDDWSPAQRLWLAAVLPH